MTVRRAHGNRPKQSDALTCRRVSGHLICMGQSFLLTVSRGSGKIRFGMRDDVSIKTYNETRKRRHRTGVVPHSTLAGLSFEVTSCNS